MVLDECRLGPVATDGFSMTLRCSSGNSQRPRTRSSTQMVPVLSMRAVMPTE